VQHPRLPPGDPEAATALDLIRQLNSKLRGWANQQRYLVSSRAFRYVDKRVFQALWQWAKRRHPTKGKGWVRAKYCRTVPKQGSTFTAPRKNPDGSWGNLDLYRTSSMPIRRHVKVQAEATAYDPAYDDYFRQRREKQRRARARVFAPARTKP
jgi:RNA-directed DNA polymerase